MPGPLDGIRVLDFGRYIAGPWCAALLGDLGAEVIRIDKRGGSEDRFVGPVAVTRGAGNRSGLVRSKATSPGTQRCTPR